MVNDCGVIAMRNYYREEINKSLVPEIARDDVVYELSQRCEGSRHLWDVTPEHFRVEEMMSMIAHQDILYRDHSKTPLENIDDVLAAGTVYEKDEDKKYSFNTYPFGNPTEEVYPKFLAICRGTERLNATLKVIKDQSKKIARLKNDGNEWVNGKCVVLLTDKWDQKVFKKYEEEFIKRAIYDDIRYMFFLVTDYGYTQIPFLPNRRDELDKFRKTKFVKNKGISNIKHRIDGYEFEYACTYRESPGTWAIRSGRNIELDLNDRIWEVSRGYESQSGKIPLKACERFLRRLKVIEEYPRCELASNFQALDAGFCELNIYGHMVTWSNIGDMEGEDELVKLCREEVYILLKQCGIY